MKMRMIAVALILAMSAWLPTVAQQSAPAPSSSTEGTAQSDSGKPEKTAACCRAHMKDQAATAKCCEGKDMSCCKKNAECGKCCTGENSQCAKDGKGCCGKDAKSCCGKNATACNTKNGKHCCGGHGCAHNS